MHFRKERALALLAGNGAAGLIAAQQAISVSGVGVTAEAFENPAFANLMTICLAFIIATFAAFLALGKAGSETGKSKFFRIAETIAALPVILFAVALAVALAVGLLGGLPKAQVP